MFFMSLAFLQKGFIVVNIEKLKLVEVLVSFFNSKLKNCLDQNILSIKSLWHFLEFPSGFVFKFHFRTLALRIWYGFKWMFAPSASYGLVVTTCFKEEFFFNIPRRYSLWVELYTSKIHVLKFYSPVSESENYLEILYRYNWVKTKSFEWS